MRRHSLFIVFGLIMVIAVAGCSDGSFTATIGATNTPQLSPSATTASETSTPSSHPAATNTPPSNTHHQTPTPTTPPVPTDCGSITATIVVTSAGNTVMTKPSDPQPLENCFYKAFFNCVSATIAFTFIDGAGDKGDYGISAPDSQGGCKVAKIDETDFKANGSITSSTFTCKTLVPFNAKYILGGCSNNQSIYFP